MPMTTAEEIRSHPGRFVKLRLAEPRARENFPFGGNPPEGIHPNCATDFTAYLTTIPFDSHLCCSVFINLTSVHPSSPFFVFSAAGVAHDETSSLVEAVWHAPIAEVGTVPLPCRLPRLAFEVEGLGLDEGVEVDVENDSELVIDNENFYDHHKLGGGAYFYQAGDAVVELAHALCKDGFHHHFQLAFPGPNDADVDCNWPFGEYVFHVFARPCNDRWELRFVWS